MAISPPSDLVLDVAKAADPQKLKVAAAKLQSIANDTYANGGDFGRALDRFPGAGAVAGYGSSIAAQRVGMHSRTAVAGNALSPNQQFEALILQQFIETMMPDDAEQVFGKGTAGEIWKSMMAEQIGKQVVSSGGVGIAEMLDRSMERNS